MKRPAIIENKPCVYMIKNTVNGKVYIGSSVDANNRYKSHTSHLKKGVHHSVRLQRSFDKYGEEAFVFIVLKYTDKNEHRKEEARVLKMLDATNPEKGYNNSDLTDLGVIRHTETSKEKMKKSQQARVVNMTDEDRTLLIKGGKKTWEGKSEEEVRAHCKKASNAAIKKTSRAVICSNGMRFDSLADAGRYFGVAHVAILHLIKKQRPGGVSGCGKHSKLNGLSFNYVEETENVG